MTAEQRARLALVGRDAFIREEMTRLGFWPPSPEVAEKAAVAERELKPLYAELAEARKQLSDANAQIGAARDVEGMINEVRKRRIERVRAERATKATGRAQARAAKRDADQKWRATTLPFLGHGVSAGLTSAEIDDGAKLAKANLPMLLDASGIASAIGITERELAWLCYHRRASGVDHYARFVIPKRRGGLRVLASPKTRLRVAQRWLLHEIVNKLPAHDAAKAFVPGGSILQNAAPHAGRAVVVKIDLKDFFGSLGWKRVKRLFVDLGYGEAVASILALLSTETPRVAVTFDGARRFVAVGERSLPQGACTSPGLTNALCRRLDNRLLGAAKSLGFVYTRYADDLTFSHNSSDAPVGKLLGLVRKIVTAEKLEIRDDKTQVLRPSDCQSVTGIIVNAPGAPRVSRENLRRLRAICHRIDAGDEASVTQSVGSDARSYARGYVSFVRMVQPEQAARLVARHPWLG